MWRDDPGLYRAVVMSIQDVTRQLIADDQAGSVVTVIAGDSPGAKAVLSAGGETLAGNLPEEVRAEVSRDAIELITRERSMTLAYGDTEVFFEVLAPRPHLFVFGAVHIAQELVTHAGLLGFRTVVADPRPAFANEDRFPDADEIRTGWPNEVCGTDSLDARTFVVVLSHDRRFEDPLWPIVLPSKARYIGAMGSAKTTARRRERLLGQGFSVEQVDRIHGPVGLSIGARTAGETAVAIIAEMIIARYSATEPLDVVGERVRV